jgi:hypothetical protein
VASEEQLAVVEKAELLITFHAIQPDAQFIFRNTISLNIDIIDIKNLAMNSSAADAATCINIWPDPFIAIHCMPNLENITLYLDESVKRVDSFTPSLPKLKTFKLTCSKLVEFAPTAFDHLVGLDEFRIYADHARVGFMEKFETALTPRVLGCYSVKLIKLNSPYVHNIEQITAIPGIIESERPLSGLEQLSISRDRTVDFSVFFHQLIHLRVLSLDLQYFSQIDQGQLSCLSALKCLIVGCKGTVNEGIF